MTARSLLALLAGAVACHSEGSPSPSRAAAPDAPLCGDVSAGAPLRRLTRFDYQRTLEALTGAEAAIFADPPGDEPSLGFDDNAQAYSVTALHASKYFEIAERAARALLADGPRRESVADCNPLASTGRRSDFLRVLGLRAYRRPLADDELERLLAIEAATSDPAPPDAELPAAAARGALDTDAGLLGEADRLLPRPEAFDAFEHFVMNWWELDALPSVEQDRSLYRTWGIMGLPDTSSGAREWCTGPLRGLV